jgi:hypothetical protein
VSASKTYCANCRRAIAKLLNKRRLRTLEANRVRNERYWLTPKAKQKRLLRSISNMTIEQLANLEESMPKPDELKLFKLKSPRLKSSKGPPNTTMEGAKPKRLSPDELRMEGTKSKPKTHEELLQELELDRIRLKSAEAEARREREKSELDFILYTNLKKKG